MAIAIITSPNVNAPAFNQIIFDVSSTNAGQTNFQFLADVYVGSTLVSRLVFPKQPSVNTLKVDISPVMKNYVSYDIENVYSTISAANTNSQALYYVQFGEVYDVSGIPTTYADLRRSPSSGSNSVYNSIFDFVPFLVDGWTNYDVQDAGAILSNRPEAQTIKQGQASYLSYYDPNGVVKKVNIKTVASNYAASSVVSATYKVFNVGVPWSYLVTHGLDTLALSGGYYDIELLDVSDEIVSTTRINISTCSDKYEVFRLHWLNNLGGWDAFNFDKVSLEGMDIERNQFKKILPLGYDINDRLKTNYQTTITDRTLITSNWVSDEVADWLQSLVQSPIVLLETSDGMIAINITDSSYDIQKYSNGRQLHNLTLNFEYSYNRYRQTL